MALRLKKYIHLHLLEGKWIIELWILKASFHLLNKFSFLAISTGSVRCLINLHMEIHVLFEFGFSLCETFYPDPNICYVDFILTAAC